jgi:hypothetical protein
MTYLPTLVEDAKGRGYSQWTIAVAQKLSFLDDFEGLRKEVGRGRRGVARRAKGKGRKRKKVKKRKERLGNLALC